MAKKETKQYDSLLDAFLHAGLVAGGVVGGVFVYLLLSDIWRAEISSKPWYPFTATKSLPQ